MTALYIEGTSTQWEGMEFDCIIVDDDKVDEFLKQGYVRHPLEIKPKPLDLKVEKTASRSRKVKKDELDKKTVN